MRPSRSLLLGGLVGAGLFGGGFRLTDEVLVVLPAIVLCGAAGGALLRPNAWRWGMGLGLGILVAAVVAPPPPYVPDARHLALYGAPKPLPLPLGLTASPLAQQLSVALIVATVAFGAALGGRLLRKLSPQVPTGH